MKKLVLILAVAFGASMVACSSSDSKANADAAADSANVVVEEVVAEVEVDSAAVDSAAVDTAAVDTAAVK